MRVVVLQTQKPINQFSISPFQVNTTLITSLSLLISQYLRLSEFVVEPTVSYDTDTLIVLIPLSFLLQALLKALSN